MTTDDNYTASRTDKGSTTVSRSERDSSWVMVLVLLVLLGLGFVSLMNLSSQQVRTERAVYELRREFHERQLAEKLSSSSDVLESNREEVYKRLNSESPNQEENADSSKTSPDMTPDTTSEGDSAPPIDSVE